MVFQGNFDEVAMTVNIEVRPRQWLVVGKYGENHDQNMIFLLNKIFFQAQEAIKRSCAN